MNGESLNIKDDKLKLLKQALPEVIIEGKVDWEKLKATLGEEINFENERYVLNWAGKSDAFKVLQQPTTATLIPDKEESVNFDETEHVFIEGENLEVLKVLQKSYYGKVKMIYIDPPYNTGSDSFIYPDKFSETRDEYLKRVGEKDEEGYLTKEGLFRKNSRDSGHYHSNWLSMMYPRLFLARNLLRDDGVIFVSIDDNEVNNLRMMMNEIFGEENFVESIIWKRKTGAGAKTKGFITLHEYILCYFKNINIAVDIEIPYAEKTQKMYNKKDENYEKYGPYATWPLDTTSMDERKNLVYPINYEGVDIWPKKQWLWSKERVDEALKNNMLIFNKREDGSYNVRFKGYLYDDKGQIRKGKPLSIIEGIYTQEGTKDFAKVFDRAVFPFPKPVKLLKQLLNCYINGQDNKNDIILDFFCGSGTLAHAVYELNKEDSGKRKFICIQLNEKTEEDSFAHKAGYNDIAQISKDRIKKVSKLISENHNKENSKNESSQTKLGLYSERETKISVSENSSLSNSDFGFKVFKLEKSNFKIWHGNQFENGDQLEFALQEHANPVSEDAKEENILYELMLKSGYELTCKIEKKGDFYLVDGELVIALSSMTEKIVKAILDQKPQKCITLDKLFEGNDQLKTNTALQMKDAGVEFKTI